MTETTREATIQGLRELADFLTAHPAVPISKHTINEFLDTSEEQDDLRADATCAWTVIKTDEFDVLRKRFAGGIVLEVNRERPTDDVDPEAHAFQASPDFSDVCKVCGESEAVHG